MKLVKTASGKQTIKISKKEWTSIGKKAGWMKKQAGCPFTVDSLIRRAYGYGLISTQDVMDEKLRDAAQSQVEFFSDWPDDQGFGSSDFYGAITSMLRDAGLTIPTEEEKQKNRQIATNMMKLFNGN